jgi:lycopene beta-cyclase
MIAPGVFGKTDSTWEQSVKKNFGLFVNSDFRRDLELKPYTYNRIIASDFTAKYLI